MELNIELQLKTTRDKLAMLEASYEEMRQDTSANDDIRTASLRSLKRLINQLKEEIARYEAQQAVRQ